MWKFVKVFFLSFLWEKENEFCFYPDCHCNYILKYCFCKIRLQCVFWNPSRLGRRLSEQTLESSTALRYLYTCSAKVSRPTVPRRQPQLGRWPQDQVRGHETRQRSCRRHLGDSPDLHISSGEFVESTDVWSRNNFLDQCQKYIIVVQKRNLDVRRKLAHLNSFEKQFLSCPPHPASFYTSELKKTWWQNVGDVWHFRSRIKGFGSKFECPVWTGPKKASKTATSDFRITDFPFQFGAYEKDGKIHMDMTTYSNADIYTRYMRLPWLLSKVRKLMWQLQSERSRTCKIRTPAQFEELLPSRQNGGLTAAEIKSPHNTKETAKKESFLCGVVASRFLKSCSALVQKHLIS